MLEKLLSICKTVFSTTAPTPQRHTQKSRQGPKGAAKATYIAVRMAMPILQVIHPKGISRYHSLTFDFTFMNFITLFIS